MKGHRFWMIQFGNIQNCIYSINMITQEDKIIQRIRILKYEQYTSIEISSTFKGRVSL